MFNFTIKIAGDIEVKQKIDKMPETIMRAFKQAMTRTIIKLASYIAKNKLSGQVLKVRTGMLRRSLLGSVNSQDAVKSFPDGVEGKVGTNLVYARIHEYGGVIKPKRANALCFVIDGHFIRVKQVKIPERSYLRTGLREQATDLIQFFSGELQKEINEVWTHG